MGINVYLLSGLLLSLLVIMYLALKLHRVCEQLAIIKDALADIKTGNLNRRVLTRENDMNKANSAMTSTKLLLQTRLVLSSRNKQISHTSGCDKPFP